MMPDAPETTRTSPVSREDLFTRVNSLFGTYGGMTPDAIGIWQLLLEQQRENRIQGDMLEIGVLHGGAAAMLAAHLDEGERFAGIDLIVHREAVERSVAHVDRRALPKLSFLQGDSRQLSRTGALDAWRGRCRFMHIDGEHSYDAVRCDLELCEQLMTEDAVIAVDDILSADSVCVTHALFDHLHERPHRLRMFLCGTNKAYLCTPSRLEFYRAVCLRDLVPFVETMTGARLRLSKNSHAWELPYLSVTHRGNGAAYMRINQYLDEPPR